MSEVNATLRLTVKEDATSRLKAARAEMVNLQGAADKTKTSVSSAFSALSGPLLKIGATAAIAQLGKSAIMAASDLNELTSKAQFVFKDAFPRVTTATAKAGEEMGRARSQMLGFSADMGAVLESTGLSTQAVGDMSVGLSKLAVDLGSFHNVSDQDAFGALRSAITGETEPMKRLGVVMTQTNLEAYALSKGIKTGTLEMSQAQLATLRYNYILEHTQTVQGDAIRTGNGLANQMKRLQGEWQNFLEAAGTPLLPVIADAFHGVNSLIGSTTASISHLKAEIIDLYHLKINQELGMGSRIQDGLVVTDYAKPGFKQANEEGVYKNVEAVSSAVRGGGKDWASYFNELGNGAGKGGKEGEDRLKKVKDAMADLGKTYSDSARTIVQKLVDMDTTHREKMKGFRDELDQTAKSIKDLETQYTRSLDEMDKRDADTLIQAGEKITDLEKKLEDFNRKRESIYQNGGSIGVDLQDDIDQTTSELARLKAAQQSGLSSSTGGVREAFDQRSGMTDLERTLADSQARREQLTTEYNDRKTQLDTEKKAVEDKQKAEETAYSSARGQLLLTKSAMADFTTDYSLKMADLSKVTEDTVGGMKTKLDELRETIGSIDALLQANATITGGGTLAERSAARGVQRGAAVPFADGGIVDRPTLALIGEAGREAVIPLDKGNLGGAVSQNITIGPFYVSEKADVNEVVNAITRRIQLASSSAK